MHKLIVAFSGKKQAGKTSACKFVWAKFVNNKLGNHRFYVNNNGDLLDSFDNDRIINFSTGDPIVKSMADIYKVCIYSFADPLKDFVANTFGINRELLYGTDNDKNTKTHIIWENLPPNIRTKYAKPRRGVNEHQPAFGGMTIREVLQVFGTDICRAMDENCWARSLYHKIQADDSRLAIIGDVRFPNEVTIGTELGTKVIRLLRNEFPSDIHPSELALDNFPLGEFTETIDNINMDVTKQNEVIDKLMNRWFKDYGLFN